MGVVKIAGKVGPGVKAASAVDSGSQQLEPGPMQLRDFYDSRLAACFNAIRIRAATQIPASVV